MRRTVEALIREALGSAMAAGALPACEVPSFTVEVPNDPTFGDLATNAAMVLARPMGRPPRVIAQAIVDHLRDPEGWIAGTEIAGPGFVNVRVSLGLWRTLLRGALAAGPSYGESRIGEGQRVLLEFVSANPTGPLHIGHGRGAVTGDVIARLLVATGHEVVREYYVNDFGRQMDMLAVSLWFRYREAGGDTTATLPEGGYPGAYLVDVAQALRAEDGDRLLALPEADAVARCREFGGAMLLGLIRRDLDRFGVRFDRFVSEKGLHTSGAFERAMAALDPTMVERTDDGALFFKSTTFGDEKDRALVRHSGEPTYFGGDLAHFHQTLGERFDRLLNVLGADHHGYVARLKAIVAAFGGDPEALRVVLVQLVNLTRGGEPVRMGKRAGEFVTLADVLDEVGPDVARFFFLLRKADSKLDFDLALAKKQSADNPVFYVQYAYTRIASVFRQASTAGVTLSAEPKLDALGEAEVPLLRCLLGFPDVVEAAARSFEPHRVVFFAIELAAAFHRYYNEQRILTDDAATTEARLALVHCVRLGLGRALDLAGVSAPEQM